MTKPKILLVEDEERLLRIISLVFQDNGYDVKTAAEGGQAMSLWQKWHPDLVITDLNMKPVDGMALLRFGRLNYSTVPLIILTAFGSIETAVDAMKKGAFDFLTKPVDHKQLLEAAAHALNENTYDADPIDGLLGTSSIMEKIRQDIALFASTDSSVLIQGESGTGKEIAARAIHISSDRKDGPFVKVNCAAIPKDLIESELFGHKKGAFTGALQDRKGAFISADNGVLFLDEIGELPLELQAKLLHAVEEKTITPIGSNREISISVKIVSATNQNLETMISLSQFRSDLYYRLNTVNLDMPPLREKKSDIPELVCFFLEKFCRDFAKPTLLVSDDALQCLKKYTWPGNVRELKNIMERVALTCTDTQVESPHLPAYIITPKPASEDNILHLGDFDMAAQEQSLMLAAMDHCGWNQSQAARKLGITRGALRYRLQKYGIKNKTY